MISDPVKNFKIEETSFNLATMKALHANKIIWNY